MDGPVALPPAATAIVDVARRHHPRQLGAAELGDNPLLLQAGHRARQRDSRRRPADNDRLLLVLRRRPA